MLRSQVESQVQRRWRIVGHRPSVNSAIGCQEEGQGFPVRHLRATAAGMDQDLRGPPTGADHLRRSRDPALVMPDQECHHIQRKTVP